MAASRYRSQSAISALDGIPVSWKDLFDVKNTVTSQGSQTRVNESRARRDARIVSRIARAGGVCIGKTNLSEFAYSGIGTNAFYGTPRHPWSPDGVSRICGGSSSGAAAAVARGLCAVAFGTDTSGSIRIPAALTGLIGYRPTSNRYSLIGVHPLAPTLDSIGAIANSVSDLRLVDATIRNSGMKALENAGRLSTNLDRRFIFDPSFINRETESCVASNTYQFLDQLRNASYPVEVKEIRSLARVREIFDTHGTMVAAEAFASHRDVLSGNRANLIEPVIRSRLLEGAKFLAADYIALQQKRIALIRSVRAELKNAVLIFPTVPRTAPTLGEVSNPDSFLHVNSQLLKHTMIGSYLDMPGISLPSGVDNVGLPTAVLLSMTTGSDAALLDVAEQLERFVFSTL